MDIMTTTIKNPDKNSLEGWRVIVEPPKWGWDSTYGWMRLGGFWPWSRIQEWWFNRNNRS